MESTITDYVPQTESLSADQPNDLTSPSSNSAISTFPDGVSDKDTAIIPQEEAHPSTLNTPFCPNTPQTTDKTATLARSLRKPRDHSVYPHGGAHLACH